MNDHDLEISDNLIADLTAGNVLTYRRTGRQDGGRFERLFRAAWGQVPNDDRECIEEYWLNFLEISGDQPTVMVYRGVCDRVEGAFAVVSRVGCELRFEAVAVDQMPDKHVMSLIGHEIAHVFEFAVDATELRSATDPRDYLYEETEDFADATAARWGFDIEGLNWFLDEFLMAPDDNGDLS